MVVNTASYTNEILFALCEMKWNTIPKLNDIARLSNKQNGEDERQSIFFKTELHQALLISVSGRVPRTNLISYKIGLQADHSLWT